MLDRRSRSPKSVYAALAFAALALTLVLAARGSALQVTGGGPPKTDCYATFDVDASAATGNNAVTCIDGDTSCDFDGECNDSCTFHVAVCPNQSGVTGCTPSSLTKLKEAGPNKTRAGFALPANTGSACGAFKDVVVAVKLKRHGTKKLVGKRKLSLLAIANSKPKRDADKLTLSCAPRTDACPQQQIGRLTFTFSPGTTSCGGAALTPGSSPPSAGGLFNAVDGGGTKVADLGAGCLYFGGSQGNTVPPGPIPSGGKTVVEIAGDPTALANVQLQASDGSGPADCTKGPKTTKHCRNLTATACTTNDDCPPQGVANPCQPDANCYFGPPLPIFNTAFDFLSTCVVNVIAGDVSGTADLTTGNVNLTSYSLISGVYLTGTKYVDANNQGLPCPKCEGGTCNGGPRVGLSCTPTGPTGTTIECLPDQEQFLGPLSVNLAPLSTTTTSKSAADGIFCTSKFCKAGYGACTQDSDCLAGTCVAQENAGAFGLSTVRSIVTNGTPAGALQDGQAHAATLAYVFCIPAPGEPASSSADLPGPGAVSLPGTLQFTPRQ